MASTPSDIARLRVLRATGLLDTPPEPGFDRLTRLAAALLGAPVALVSLVDEERQFFKSAVGLAEPWATRRETPLSHSFCQYATRSRAPFVVADAREHPLLHDNPAIQALSAVAYAGVPLFVDDEAIGALCVLDDKPRGWSPPDLALLDDLAHLVTDEMELRRALRAAREQAALLDAVLANTDQGVSLLDAQRHIVLANDAFATMFALSPVAVEHLSLEAFGAHVATMVDDPTDFSARLAQPSSQEFTLVRPERRVLRRRWIPVSLPMGESVLVTWHDCTADRDVLTQLDRELVRDPLTGIPNRRAAERALSHAATQRARGGLPVSVALFDIDNFKQVNDRFGHPVGDEVLREVARTLASGARVADTVARWGGEEFLAVLPIGLPAALLFCERARSAVEGLALPRVGRITISSGVAEVGPDETLHDAVGRADDHLYEAKRAGRNQVRG